jgi:hypothetical protein
MRHEVEDPVAYAFLNEAAFDEAREQVLPTIRKYAGAGEAIVELPDEAMMKVNALAAACTRCRAFGPGVDALTFGESDGGHQIVLCYIPKKNKKQTTTFVSGTPAQLGALGNYLQVGRYRNRTYVGGLHFCKPRSHVQVPSNQKRRFSFLRSQIQAGQKHDDFARVVVKCEKIRGEYKGVL